MNNFLDDIDENHRILHNNSNPGRDSNTQTSVERYSYRGIPGKTVAGVKHNNQTDPQYEPMNAEG